MSRTFTRGVSRPARVIRRVRQPWRWVPFALRLRVARLRNAILQRRLVQHTARLAIAVVVIGLVLAASERSRSIQERWGDTIEVVVLDRDVRRGEPTVEIEWRRELRPVAFVAADALLAVPDADDVFIRDLHSGDVVTQRDLRSTSPALEPGEGRRAVGVPLDPSVPPLVVGDRVDLFLIADVFGGAGDAAVEQLDSAAVVLEIDADAATLSVAATDVEALAHAALHGRVVIALR